jgi:hypothetical protein
MLAELLLFKSMVSFAGLEILGAEGKLNYLGFFLLSPLSLTTLSIVTF